MKQKNKKSERKDLLPSGIPRKLKRHVRDLLKWADIDDALLLHNRAREMSEAQDRAENREKQGLSYIA